VVADPRQPGDRAVRLATHTSCRPSGRVRRARQSLRSGRIAQARVRLGSVLLGEHNSHQRADQPTVPPRKSRQTQTTAQGGPNRGTELLTDGVLSRDPASARCCRSSGRAVTRSGAVVLPVRTISTATSSDLTRRPPSWASRSTTWRVRTRIRLTLADACHESGKSARPRSPSRRSLLLLVRTRSEVDVDEGGRSPTRARARCACGSRGSGWQQAHRRLPQSRQRRAAGVADHDTGPSRVWRCAPLAKPRS
jgi:hypothetical protein